MKEIFEYNDLLIFLTDLLEHKKELNKNFSMRAWSKLLGYNFPSYLSQCLKGDRTANYGLISKIIEREHFSKDEVDYLKFLYLKLLVRGETEICLNNLSNIVRTSISS